MADPSKADAQERHSWEVGLEFLDSNAGEDNTFSE